MKNSLCWNKFKRAATFDFDISALLIVKLFPHTHLSGVLLKHHGSFIWPFRVVLHSYAPGCNWTHLLVVNNWQAAQSGGGRKFPLMSARVSAVLYGKESIRLLFRENDLAQVILHLATEKGNWLQCCFPGNNIIYRRQIHSAGITFLFGMHARAPPIIEYVLHNRIWMRRQSTWLSLNQSELVAFSISGAHNNFHSQKCRSVLFISH